MLTENFSLATIQQLRDKARHIQPDLGSYYYLEREQEFENYFKRFAQYFTFMKSQGFEIDFEDEGFRVLSHMRYTLDLGSFGLHFGVFIPTIKSLGDDQQVKQWL